MKARFPSLFLLLAVLPHLLPAQTTVTLSTSPNPSVFGAPVVLTATVTPPNATGRVTFYDGVTILGSKPLSSGTASISTILLPAGTGKLTAYYSGDATNLAGTANVTQTVKSVAEVGFRSSVVSVAPASLMNVAVGDFNGDGKADLAMPGLLTGPGSVVTILLGNGDGTFQAPAHYTVGFNPQTIAVADFNGDGNPDIAVTATDTQNNGIVSILLGNGDGTFRPVVNFSVGVGAFSAMSVADFNGDGKADLVVVGGASGATVSVLIGSGDGTFQAPLFSSFSQQPFGGLSAVAVGDFNGDGKPDLAVTAGHVFVALGNGDGTFQSPVAVTNVSVYSAGSIAAGDFNGDGKTDLAVGSYNQLVLLGNGDGTFQQPVSYPVEGRPTIIDFNGDGIPDIAVAGFATSEISILQGNGDGTFHLVLSYTHRYGSFCHRGGGFQWRRQGRHRRGQRFHRISPQFREHPVGRHGGCEPHRGRRSAVHLDPDAIQCPSPSHGGERWPPGVGRQRDVHGAFHRGERRVIVRNRGQQLRRHRQRNRHRQRRRRQLCGHGRVSGDHSFVCTHQHHHRERRGHEWHPANCRGGQ